MKSNIVAAVAGGLVLGAAVFLPMGANAINHEVQQVTQSEQKLSDPAVNVAATDVTSSVDDESRVAAVTPITATEPTSTPAPSAVAGPTFGSGDDEDSNDDDSEGEEGDD